MLEFRLKFHDKAMAILGDTLFRPSVDYRNLGDTRKEHGNMFYIHLTVNVRFMSLNSFLFLAAILML